MKIKGAFTVLKKECEFLGLTFEELLIFIERNPYAVKNSTIDAYKVYKKWKGSSSGAYLNTLGNY